MEIVFWVSGLAILYTYAGYPLLLRILPKEKDADTAYSCHSAIEPTISIIIPVYNEEKIIREKIENTLALDYPKDKREILIVSDASSDRTPEIVKDYNTEGAKLFELRERQGKASALNVGLQMAQHEIVVFSDASIILEQDALKKIVGKFNNPRIGCISGEDHIPGGGEEGAYGKYELALRNLENRVGSIVGASGCFYAQRRALCEQFREGMAPDFFSVLETVDKGYRAVTEPGARGAMKSVRDLQSEHARKVRTFLRGMTTLQHFKHLLNPFRYGTFSLQLISHKLMRWCTGIFLIMLFLSNLFLVGSKYYLIVMLMQAAFYVLALIGWLGMLRPFIFRVPYFYSMINISALVAWGKYVRGFRQEIWEPSKR